MKKVILLVIMAFALCPNLFSQEAILPIDTLTGEIIFTEVVPVDSINAIELFNRAKQWVALTYVSGKDVTQMDDKDAGALIIKALTNVYTTVMVHFGLGVVKYTLTIAVKNGKYKYTISDFWHNTDYNVNPRSNIITPGDLKNEKPGGGIMSMGMKNWNGIKIQTKKSIEDIILSLKGAMNKPSKQAEMW